MVQIIELFGGVGGPRASLRNLGIPVKSIDYVEINEKAVRSYNAIFQRDLKYKTQSVIGWNLKPDILIHGSPCQDFSIAGHQKGADEGSETSSSLMWETITIIKQMCDWKPKHVIWENVTNILSKHMVHNFNRYLCEMSKLGYTNSYEVLDARDFGLPHKRERVITISCLNGENFDFSDLIKFPMRNINEFLEENVSDRYKVTQPSLKKMIGKKGISRLDIIKDYCFTIRTRQDQAPNAGVVPLENGEYRFLTEKECWRLLGYNDSDFEAARRVNPPKKGCMNRTLYHQSGNGIAIPMLESIFRKIILKETSNNAEKLGLVI